MMWTTAPWWHWLGMASFWMVILVVAIWAIGRVAPAAGTSQHTVRSILDERLARGDLEIAEYRRLRDELTGAGQDRHT